MQYGATLKFVSIAGLIGALLNPFASTITSALGFSMRSLPNFNSHGLDKSLIARLKLRHPRLCVLGVLSSVLGCATVLRTGAPVIYLLVGTSLRSFRYS